MSKRSSPTALGEARDLRPPKQTILDDDAKAQLLSRRLATAIFGERPKNTEMCAIDYLVSMRLSPAPDVSEFVSFILAKHPDARQSKLSSMWRRMKEYFSSDTAIYETLQDLMSVESIITRFRDAPYLESEEPATSIATSALPPPAITSSLSLARSTRSRSSGSSSSSSSNSTLGSAAIIKMKEEFQKHYDAFEGNSWQLPSGTVVDQVIAEHVKTLPYESGLHSFIIEDVNVILRLFPSEADKDELKRVLVERSGEGLAKLSAEELHSLSLYDKPPRELDQLLAGGWANMPISTEGAIPDDEFRRITHCCLQLIHLIYSQGGFSLPREQSESWFMQKLWGFMNVLFDSDEQLDHQPGEVSSQASGLRKNKGRTFDERLLTGRKADGLISSAVTRLELCTIEAARKDNGASSTKALTDTRKMAKNMKDMSDMVRSKSVKCVRQSLVTYGIRISAGTIAFYTLRQRTGRFYQLCLESTISFPAIWSSDTTTTILSVLASLLAFKKELCQMARQITEATKVLLGSPLPANSGDTWAATLTTPTNSPRISPRALSDS
ncbi:hypothetical protein EC968_000881 [Mortierella alpina]|nr:hypothetical protein EC968_000881 [Mortierella alpina]